MLDATLKVGDGLTLKYHSQRPPSAWTISKLSQGLAVARAAVTKARGDFAAALTREVPEHAVIHVAALWHFKFGLIPSSKPELTIWTMKDQVLEKLSLIEAGLKKSIKLADVLGPTVWDPHHAWNHPKIRFLKSENEYFEGEGDRQSKPIAGIARAGSKYDGVSGYVQDKKSYVGKPGDPPAGEKETGSIHVHFALCESISTTAIALILIHEASHKFARTLDKAYTHNEVQYENLSMFDKVVNADSYGFFCISLWMGLLVRNDRDLFRWTQAEPAPAASVAARAAAV